MDVLTPHSLLWAKCQICSCGHVYSLLPRSTTKPPAPATSPVMSSPGVSPWWNSTGVLQNIHLTRVIRDLLPAHSISKDGPQLQLRPLSRSTSAYLQLSYESRGQFYIERLNRISPLQRFTRLANRIRERFT